LHCLKQTVSQNVQAAIGATLNYSQCRALAREARMRVSAARGWPITAVWRAAARRVSPTGGDNEDIHCSVYDYWRHIVVINPLATRLEPQIRIVLRGDQFEYGVILLQDKTVLDFFNSRDDLRSVGRPMVHEGLDLLDLGKGYLERRVFLLP
jgi:hypothetical protein